MEVYSVTEKLEFSNACSELIEIFKYLNKSDLEKIPENKIRVFESNANKDYVFTYNVNENFNKQNISKKTRELLAVLFVKYWSTEEQRKRIKEYDRQYFQKLEMEKSEKYKYEDIFKDTSSNGNIDKTVNLSENNLLVVYKKENIFIKICENIKRFFGIK